MKKTKTKNKNIFDNKRFNIIISLVLAVLVWVIVSLYIDPESTQVVSRVPVDFDYNSASYTGQNLDIINQPQTYVSITVTGDGYIAGNLKAEDFTVYPTYTQVKGSGKYELGLSAKTSASIHVDSISPSFVQLQFDKVISKKMPITVVASGIETEIGYFMDLPVAAPTEVTINGPEVQVNGVAKVVANVLRVEKRKETVITNAQLELQDKDGNVISGTDVVIDTEQVEVRIPILEEREVPITIGFAGVPAGFDINTLSLKLSAEKIRVAGPANQWNTLEKLNAGYIDLSKFELEGKFDFPITLPDNFINMDQLLNVTATFDTTGLDTKQITVSDVRVSGATPEGLTLDVPKDIKIKNVILVGPTEELENINSQSVIAQINASEVSLVGGQQNVAVQILVPSSNKVFATGAYSVLCNTQVQK